MRPLNDITLLGLVSTIVLLLAITAKAEMGPAEEKPVVKKSFNDVFADPSALLDMDDDEFSELLPPLDSGGGAERKTLSTPNQPNTNGAILASPFQTIPGTQPNSDPRAQPNANGTSVNPLALYANWGLPLVLAPEFFAAMTMRAPSNVTELRPLPPSTPMAPLPGVPDVSVILSYDQFFPSRIKLQPGVTTRLIFTTVNKRPAALVIERLQLQRWLAKEDEQKPSSGLDRIRWEISRELNSSRISEITIDPQRGVYSFHDALSGATGEIIVE